MAKKNNQPLTKEEIDQAVFEGMQIAQLVLALPIKAEEKQLFLEALQFCDYEQLQGVRQVLQKIARKALDTVIKEDFTDKLHPIFDEARKDAQNLSKKYNSKIDQLIKKIPIIEEK